MSSSARVVVKVAFKVVVNSQAGSIRDRRCILGAYFGNRIALLSTSTFRELAIIAFVCSLTLASVTISGVRTGATVLAGIEGTCRKLAIIAFVSYIALASVTINGVRTGATVLAGITSTVVDICLTVLAGVSIQTDADKDTAFVLLA
jgi:hypothetical protein